jgi:hypothetical protein
MVTATSNREAIALGLTRYFTGKPCPRGHIDERAVRSGACITCVRNCVKRRLGEKGAYWRRQLEAKYKRRYNTPEKRKAWNNRYKTNIKLKLAVYLRARINIAVRNNNRAGSAVRDLGCTIAEFKAYIEAKFTEGMSWDNYGKWHLDHKKPLALFDLSDREQFLAACHFSNFQPLWATENIAKSAKYSPTD